MMMIYVLPSPRTHFIARLRNVFVFRWIAFDAITTLWWMIMLMELLLSANILNIWIHICITWIQRLKHLFGLTLFFVRESLPLCGTVKFHEQQRYLEVFRLWDLRSELRQKWWVKAQVGDAVERRRRWRMIPLVLSLTALAKLFGMN